MEAAAAATDPSASPRPASADGSSAEPSLTDGKPVDVVVAKAYARMGSAYRKLGKHTRAVNAFLLSLKERADPQVRSPPACSTDKSQRPRPHPPPPLRAVVWLGTGAREPDDDASPAEDQRGFRPGTAAGIGQGQRGAAGHRGHGRPPRAARLPGQLPLQLHQVRACQPPPAVAVYADSPCV